MINWPTVQTRLGVKADGNPGPVTMTALLSAVATRPVPIDIGRALAINMHAYGLDASPKRLAKFVGQTCLESGRYRYTRELWGPTPAQKAYDAPGNKLGNRPGDAFPMRGTGLIQVTGRYWFDKIGHELGLDLVGKPDIANQPSVAVLISLEWWRMNNANAIADNRETLALSRLVNLGNADSARMPIGAAERAGYTDKAMEILG